MTLTPKKLTLAVAATMFSYPIYAANFESPDTVENTISAQKNVQKPLRESLADSGLTFGLDYNSQGFSSSSGFNGEKASVASGVARFYGQWNLVNLGSQNTGGFVWKIEHRHAYTDSAINSYAFMADENLGYVGMLNPAFNDQGTRITNFHWKQKLNDGKTSMIIGFQDVTDYVDVYALASPWSGFSNLAFQTGSGAMGLPDDGLLGLTIGHMITDNYYVVAGVADANGYSDVEKMFGGFDSLFNEHDLFKSIELGWTSSQENIYTNNVHVTYWHLDPTEATNGSARHSSKKSSGFNFSASYFVNDNIMPFFRMGYSLEGDAALYKTSVSTGVGYFGLGQPTNTLGVAVNWSKINEAEFGIDDSQIVAEIYYNMQFGDHFQLTPDMQVIVDPAFSNEVVAVVFGLRGRLYF
ncbi:carbohydrate porin [Photobacterium lutimaris]|uniref:Porin n=1 Tax=Photobacterium lutimaris TaxID=388278 RepID=A0A2T3J2D8_9GAMM|nr:carbohydrate porin [Photobacterium lutimaris]PSU35213.1 porin [Photobacterium lutimaris]